MTAETAIAPIILDPDDDTWNKQLDRAASWLENVILTQEKFRKSVSDTAAKIHEPHIKKYLEDIVRHAEAHEELARRLPQVIGREAAPGRSLAGAVLAKGAELVADAIDLAGGARGNWKDLRRLVIESQDALGTFAIVDQLGYPLAIPALADDAFRVAAEKAEDHLVIQEYLLEMGPTSILLHQEPV